MLPEEELIERNNRLRNAVLQKREIQFGNYNIHLEYFIYYLEKNPAETCIHTHHFWELSFLYQGEIDYHILKDERKASLQAGDGQYVLIPPYQKHFRKNTCPNALILGFMLAVNGTTPEDDRRLLEEVRKRNYCLQGSTGTESLELQQLLAHSPDVLDAEESGLRLQLLLLSIFRENFRDLFRQSPPAPPKRNPLWLAETLISENLKHPFTAEELACRCGLSRRHFYRCFESEYGMPVNEFIRRRRLLQAAHDLSYTDHPLKEIADDAGFRNMSYFIRQFRKLYSVTPGQFRRNNELRLQSQRSSMRMGHIPVSV